MTRPLPRNLYFPRVRVQRYKRKKGLVGVDITRATGFKGSVVSKPHLVASFAAMCALPPLAMGKAEFDLGEQRMEMLGIHSRRRNATKPPERHRPWVKVAHATGDLDSHM